MNKEDRESWAEAVRVLALASLYLDKNMIAEAQLVISGYLVNLYKWQWSSVAATWIAKKEGLEL